MADEILEAMEKARSNWKGPHSLTHRGPNVAKAKEELAKAQQQNSPQKKKSSGRAEVKRLEKEPFRVFRGFALPDDFPPPLFNASLTQKVRRCHGRGRKAAVAAAAISSSRPTCTTKSIWAASCYVDLAAGYCICRKTRGQIGLIGWPAGPDSIFTTHFWTATIIFIGLPPGRPRFFAFLRIGGRM